ncbi:shikimate dehydrogenase [Jiangella endophytica]|uniref:shikimate dehydrogenase n=1 Tax=Jiangella endophytica TaxID=1623398 RepID=UPI000E342186|nr:shikimate dehydrogenase [Jiangella endophytica]
MTGRSVLAGLFGQGVKPSLTPELHEREAQRHGLRYVYKVVDLADAQLPVEHLEQLLDHAIALGFDGLNVTHPLKQVMVPLVDEVAPDVAAIGALNTILIADGATIGHNTDVTGFASAFGQGLPDAGLDHVVLLGAGGAGTAVAHALVRLGVRRLAVTDPDVSRVAALAGTLAGSGEDVRLEVLAAADLTEALAGADGLVNASPVGMAGHPGSPVEPGLLHPGLWVADIVYRPVMTPLLQHAQRTGCRTLTGAGMAVHQAADAFELITGQPAHREAMFGDLDDLIAAEVENVPPHQELSHERKP